MTIIVVDPAETLLDALRQAFGNVVGIEGHTAADDTMWEMLVALKTAHSAMPSGGRVVVILPTIGIAGAAGLVDYTTAVEGIRAMAKSAARRWASERIGVNMIAAPLNLFAADGDTSHLTAAAVRNGETLIHSIVETARFLLREDPTDLTGDTVIVDGGSVMLP